MAANPGNPRPSQLGMPKLSTSGPAQVVVARCSIEALQAGYAWSLQSSTLYTTPDCWWPGLAAPHKSPGHQAGGTYWQVIQSQGTSFRNRGTLYGPPYMASSNAATWFHLLPNRAFFISMPSERAYAVDNTAL